MEQRICWMCERGHTIADLTGSRFGTLLVVELRSCRSGGLKWLCQCDCGAVKEKWGHSLRSGQTSTCGNHRIHHQQERVSYGGAHDRLRAYRGWPTDFACVDCGRPAEEWSYDGQDPDELVGERGLKYSLKSEHYEPRCVGCHRKLDVRGERHPRAKLNNAKVLAIRDDPRRHSEIAESYGVAASTVSKIKRRKGWRHI